MLNQNQVATEAANSATYVENYLDSVENLPDDVQRYLSRIREIDVQYRGYLRDVDNYYEQWSTCLSNDQESATSTKRNRAMTRMQQSLIAAQELGDEKLHIVTQLQELIDQKTRQLEQDFQALDYGKDEPVIESLPKDIRPSTPTVASPISSTAPISVFPLQTVTTAVSTPSLAPTNERYTTPANATNNSNERPNKRVRRTRNEINNSALEVINSSDQVPSIDGQQKMSSNTTNQGSAASQKKTNSTGGKKKKRKSGRQSNSNAQAATREARDETPPIEEAIDPDEPTYCLCDQISFGEMILCDNDLCPIEWFHFSCVSLMSKPKGKWFCPNCRGERPNVMKPKAQFLKELERYNKEKEEKT